MPEKISDCHSGTVFSSMIYTDDWEASQVGVAPQTALSGGQRNGINQLQFILSLAAGYFVGVLF
jgi:hypothetical protein